jgi:hypothetical protein
LKQAIAVGKKRRRLYVGVSTDTNGLDISFYYSVDERSLDILHASPEEDLNIQTLTKVSEMSEIRRELKDFILASLHNNLTESSEVAEQPESILTSLRPHQLTLLAAARTLEKRSSLKEFRLDTPMLVTRYGILADRVGSGKSLVALSLVNDPAPEQTRVITRQGNHYGDAVTLNLNQMPAVTDRIDALKDLSGSNIDLIKSPDGHAYVRTALCIVPHNVCNQWETYIKEQTNLNAIIVKRTKDCERPAWDLFRADIVLVSSTMLKKFMSGFADFSSIVWSRLFVDEADSIQCTVRHGEIQARFTWFITASWVNMLFPGGIHSYSVNNLPEDLRACLGNGNVYGIQSRYGFIFNTLSDTRYAAFTQLLVRNSEAWIDVSLKRPVIAHDTIFCKTPANLSILRGFISPAAMEALHAGDTVGALEALGLKTTTKETLVGAVVELMGPCATGAATSVPRVAMSTPAEFAVVVPTLTSVGEIVPKVPPVMVYVIR